MNGSRTSHWTKRGIAVDSVDLNFRMNATGNAVPELRKAQGAVQRLGTQIDKSNARMRGFNNGITTMQAKSRKFAMGGLQQAGYQLGDYAVQVANGTSKMQAFGQQAPQFLQIFGPIGAVLGAATAIFSAFVVAVQRTKDATKEVTSPIQSLSTALSVAEGQAKLTGEAFDEYLTQTFEGAEVQIKSMVARLETIKLDGLSASITKLLKDSAAPLSEVTEQFDSVSLAVKQNFDEIMRLGENAPAGARQGLQSALESAREFKEEIGLTTNEYQIFLDNMQKVKASKTFDELVLSVVEMERHLAQVSEGPMESFKRSLTTLLQQEGVFDRMAEGGAAIGKEMEESAGKAKKLGTTVLSTAEAMFLLNKGVLPPQARNDLIEMEGLYKAIEVRIRKAGDEAVRLGRTTLSAVEAEFMLRQGSLPEGAREDFPAIDKSYQRIRKSIEAANKAAARTGSVGSSSAKSLAVVINSELSPAMQRLKGIQDSVASSFENAMMSAVDGTNSVKNAFKSMASEIIKELYRVFVVKRITGFISSAIGGYFNTNQVAGASMPLGTGNVRPMARPASFAGGGYTGNGARAGGLDGKGGRMAMIHPRETVIDHTKGQGMGGVTVIQNNTFGSGVSRAEVNSMLPKMIEATKAAVVDAKRQGGSYGRAFG